MPREGRRVERTDEGIELMSEPAGIMKVNENGKVVISTDKPQTLWGLPVVISEAVPRGTAIMGRFPTWEEVLKYGSFEKAIEAQKRGWAMIKGLPSE
jgi:hypothetical protein